MPSTFSPDKGYELMQTGEQNGVWGVKTNANLSIIDLNFGGRLDISVAGSSDIDISAEQAENVYHVITGVLTGSINYKLPNTGGFYYLNNGTTGAFTLTAIATGGTGIVIPQGTTVGVFVNPDTTALTKVFNYTTNVFGGSTTGGSGNAQTITVDSNFTLAAGNVITCKLGFSNSGAMTLAVNGGSAKNVTDVKTNAIASGMAISGQIAIFAYDGTQFQLLNPATLPVVLGGTGAATLTANNVILGNGTSAVQFVAPSTSGNVLTSNGTTWASVSPTAALLAAVYPIGSYYFNETDPTNPATLFGFGTWTAVADKFIVGHGSTYTSTGGAATSTIGQTHLPNINLLITALAGVLGDNMYGTGPSMVGTADNCSSSGGSQKAFLVPLGGSGTGLPIIPPYQAAYIWKRTA